jgi:hypothetical protein
MFARFRNGSNSVLCTMNTIAARLKTYLEGVQHVGIVIHDKNVCSIHFSHLSCTGEAKPRARVDYYSIFGIIRAHLMAGKLYQDEDSFGNFVVAERSVLACLKGFAISCSTMDSLRDLVVSIQEDENCRCQFLDVRGSVRIALEQS